MCGMSAGDVGGKKDVTCLGLCGRDFETRFRTERERERFVCMNL